MNDKLIMVEILDDLSTLSVQHGGEFLKDDTNRIMSTTYKVLRTMVERASSATSDEDVAPIRAEVAFALDQFENRSELMGRDLSPKSPPALCGGFCSKFFVSL